MSNYCISGVKHLPNWESDIEIFENISDLNEFENLLQEVAHERFMLGNSKRGHGMRNHYKFYIRCRTVHKDLFNRSKGLILSKSNISKCSYRNKRGRINIQLNKRGLDSAFFWNYVKNELINEGEIKDN